MSRTNKKGELFSHLSFMGVFRDKSTTPGTTTTSAVVDAKSATLPITAVSSFSNGDYVRVDSGETVEILKIQGTPATALPLREPTGMAHDSGVEVVEQVLTNLGNISDAGFRMNLSGDDSAVFSATRGLAVGYLKGNLEMIFEVELEGFNLANIATVLGIPESAITGTGSLESPHSLFSNGENIRTENDLSFLAQGARKDGKIVNFFMMGVELDFTALTTALARGTPALLPLRGRVTSGVRWSTHATV